MKTIKCKDILFRVKSKKTGKEGWVPFESMINEFLKTMEEK